MTNNPPSQVVTAPEMMEGVSSTTSSNNDIDLPESLPEVKKTAKRFLEEIASPAPSLSQPAAVKKIHHLGSNNFLPPPWLPPSHTPMEDEWPYELILVRHGQSEGNLAQARSKAGDMSSYTPEFRKKHSSAYRLTDKGRAQATSAGEWIKKNMDTRFDRYYTSEYVRAMETAALLELPDGKWYTEIVLRERDKGHLDNVSWTEKNERFSDEMALRKRDSFFWAPPGGESIAQVCVRVDHTFNTLRRECSNKRVIIVCHGEVMWAFRVRLERLNSVRFHKLQASTDKRDLIHNGSILHYSRIHPKTGEVSPTFRYMKHTCAWRPEYSSKGWMEFDRPIYTNEELLETVNTVPRLVNNRVDDS
eukprot:TRINITY_DN13016_c0_g1_i1.p1 TRINITY_DN13016_c0_g1~~TRINITY_DN13016_c0_g1_i1.p1  ORF type:complete len:370 (+),score=97.41 TRINITY_DN13016_c0_g1_i1:30-1112(+)